MFFEQPASFVLTYVVMLLAFVFVVSPMLGRPGAAGFAGLLAFGVLALWGFRYLAEQAPPTSRPLGTLLGVMVEAGNLFSPSVSVVATSSGFYTVRGAVSAARGAAVTEQRNRLGTTRICTAQSCHNVPRSD